MKEYFANVIELLSEQLPGMHIDAVKRDSALLCDGIGPWAVTVELPIEFAACRSILADRLRSATKLLVSGDVKNPNGVYLQGATPSVIVEKITEACRSGKLKAFSLADAQEQTSDYDRRMVTARWQHHYRIFPATCGL